MPPKAVAVVKQLPPRARKPSKKARDARLSSESDTDLRPKKGRRQASANKNARGSDEEEEKVEVE